MIERIWILIIRRNGAPVGWSSATTITTLGAVLNMHGLDEAKARLEKLTIMEDQFLYSFAADGDIYELYRCDLYG